MNMLFINGSPNKNGNTAALAAKIANGKPYKTLNLTDYRINCYGQTLPGDQFDEVVAAMRDADTVIIGSPLYWHNICGSVRNLLDRFYGPVESGSMRGKKLMFILRRTSIRRSRLRRSCKGNVRTPSQALPET